MEMENQIITSTGFTRVPMVTKISFTFSNNGPFKLINTKKVITKKEKASNNFLNRVKTATKYSALKIFKHIKKVCTYYLSEIEEDCKNRKMLGDEISKVLDLIALCKTTKEREERIKKGEPIKTDVSWKDLDILYKKSNSQIREIIEQEGKKYINLETFRVSRRLLTKEELSFARTLILTKFEQSTTGQLKKLCPLGNFYNKVSNSSLSGNK